MRCDSRTLVAQQVLTVLERHACGPQPSTEGVLQIVLLRFISMGFIDGTAAVVVTDSSARLAQLVHSDRTQLAALDVVGSSGLTCEG